MGTDQKYSVYDLSVAVAKAMGVPHQVTNLPARNEVVDAYASHDKLRCFFNPSTPVSLEEGLKVSERAYSNHAHLPRTTRGSHHPRTNSAPRSHRPRTTQGHCGVRQDDRQVRANRLHRH